MDWLKVGESSWEGLAPDGFRWTIRRCASCRGWFSLFRRPPGARLPSEPVDQDDACAILRSPGEAKIMAALLDGKAGAAVSIPLGFRQIYDDGEEGRKAWEMSLGNWSLAIHCGSDQDRRDVVVEHSNPMVTGVFAVLSHGANSHMPPGARSLQSVCDLLSLVLDGRRIRRPLNDEDFRLWSLGKPIATRDSGSPESIERKARALTEIGDEIAGLGDAARMVLERYDKGGLDRGQLASFRSRAEGDPGFQYHLLAVWHGEDRADAILDAIREEAVEAPVPSP